MNNTDSIRVGEPIAELCDTPEHTEQINLIIALDNLTEGIKELMAYRGVEPITIASLLEIPVDDIERWLNGGFDITVGQIVKVMTSLGYTAKFGYAPMSATTPW